MSRALLFFALAGFVVAETPTADSGPMLRFIATTANVTGAPDTIRIDVFRWSTDEERDKLMAAWEGKAPVAGGRGAAGRGAGRAGAAKGGAGRAGRGGQAPGEGATAPAAPKPEALLAAALKEASTVGYLWSSEIAGYALRYAGKIALPDGSSRVVLITDRRLGQVNGLWKLPGQTAAPPGDFSIIELRVNAKGTGEGKASLGGKIGPDAAAKIVTLSDYDSEPVVLTNLKQTTNRAK